MFVPLFRRRGPIGEVVELCSAHAPIAQAAANRRRALLGTVLLGALALWLAVLPGVLTSARLLAERAERRNRRLVRALRDATALAPSAPRRRPASQLPARRRAHRGHRRAHAAHARARHAPGRRVAPARARRVGRRQRRPRGAGRRRARERARRAARGARPPGVGGDARDHGGRAGPRQRHGGPRRGPRRRRRVHVDRRLRHRRVLARAARPPAAARAEDRPRVRHRRRRGGSQTLLAAIIRTGRELGLRTVAEGVESEEMVETLRTMGCDAVQGFHISRPRCPPRGREVVARAP